MVGCLLVKNFKKHSSSGKTISSLWFAQESARKPVCSLINESTEPTLAALPITIPWPISFFTLAWFSVYAAAGGAKKVFSVDISEPAIEDAKENFRLNGLDPDMHVFHATDAFQWQSPEPLSLLICDPPSLSHDQKKDSNASKAYEDLATHCAKQLKRGDLLATASCTSRLSQSKWETAVAGTQAAWQMGLALEGCRTLDHPVSTFHPEGRYLKFSIAAKMR